MMKTEFRIIFLTASLSGFVIISIIAAITRGDIQDGESFIRKKTTDQKSLTYFP